VITVITKILTYYAVALGTVRALRKVREEIRYNNRAMLIGNELRSLTIWYRDGSVYHEETP
jgi:hypothetical protein